MQSETPEIEPFRYPESPWRESSVGSGEVFPVLDMERPEPGRGSDTWSREGLPDEAGDGDGSRDRSRLESNPAGRHGRLGTNGFPQSYDYGGGSNVPGSAQAGGTDTKDAPTASGGPSPEIRDEVLFQQLLAVEAGKAEERGRSKGLETGLAQGRRESAEQLENERARLVERVAELAKGFSEARESCLHSLEQEAVKLALAIAARILRREAQMDPLLLTGAVRVALGQLAASTAVRLRVPQEDQVLWEEALARIPGLKLRPQVIGESGMELGDCRMETELGSADLGLWPQLKAIEKGFFERAGDSFGLRGSTAEGVEEDAVGDRQGAALP